MLEEITGIQETVDEKETYKEGEKYLHTLQEKGTCFFALHPTNHPKHMRQEDRNTGESETKDFNIDVRTDVSDEEY